MKMEPDSFRAADFKYMMHDMFPGIEDGRDDTLKCEHPWTAVGIVLLSAAVLGTVAKLPLMTFTGYSYEFISAIRSNMRTNGFWMSGRYDTSSQLLVDGIDQDELFQHIEMACGELWQPYVTDCVSEDPCRVYWDEYGGLK